MKASVLCEVQRLALRDVPPQTRYAINAPEPEPRVRSVLI